MPVFIIPRESVLESRVLRRLNCFSAITISFLPAQLFLEDHCFMAVVYAKNNLLKWEIGRYNVCFSNFSSVPSACSCLKDGKGDVAFVKHTTVQGTPARSLISSLSSPTSCCHSILKLVYTVQLSFLSRPKCFFHLLKKVLHIVN